MKKKLGMTLALFLFTLSLTGCSIASWSSGLNDIKGKLVGNSFHCYFYDNYGEKYMTVSGQKIGLTGNIVPDIQIDAANGSIDKAYSLSSVVTIDIDGNEIESCGDTIIFEETGLSPDAEFEISDINSSSGGLTSATSISNIMNQYKNYFGRGQVVLIQSQLGQPICAYSGDDVYWEIRDDLPKTTKLMIDGKALYIHRANFQIIDKDLLEAE